jgi:hypothetical protein
MSRDPETPTTPHPMRRGPQGKGVRVKGELAEAEMGGRLYEDPSQGPSVRERPTEE